jgi:hypothetical protein
MESVRVPMHLPGGSLLSMSDILSTFPENESVWVIFEFFGIGCAPKGMSMPDFEDQVRSAPEGLQMTWSELREFGADVAQAFDCEIAAFRVTDYPAKRRGIGLSIAKICALDSTEWQVAVDETVEEFQSVLSTVQHVATGTR